MSTAAPFKAIGRGNGFPFCLQSPFTFPYSYSGTPSLASFEGLAETMEFFWLFERLQVSFDVVLSNGSVLSRNHDSDTTFTWTAGEDWYDAVPEGRACERPPPWNPGQIRGDTPLTGVTTGEFYFYIEESNGEPHARILVECQGTTFNGVTVAVTSLDESDEFFVNQRSGFFGWGTKLSGPDPITMIGSNQDLFIYTYMSPTLISNGVTLANVSAIATFYTI